MYDYYEYDPGGRMILQCDDDGWFWDEYLHAGCQWLSTKEIM